MNVALLAGLLSSWFAVKALRRSLAAAVVLHPTSPPSRLLSALLQRDGADSNRLPTSHTCFNSLLLPSYRSKEKLADRLRLAILNSEGFGLE